jgi:hypothetical protein
MIKALNAGLDVSRDPFAEFSFLSQDGKGSLGRGSSFVARDVNTGQDPHLNADDN